MLERAAPAFDCFHIEEPRVLFGNGQPGCDPKVGLAAFGPYGVDADAPKTIKIGVIGTGGGLEATRAFFERCLNGVKPGLNGRGKHFDVLCFPDFPGLGPENGFRARFKLHGYRDIPKKMFEHAVKPGPVTQQLCNVVALIDKQLEMMTTEEPLPDVVLIVLPKCVEDQCATVGSSYMRARKPLSLLERLIKSFAREKAKKVQGVLDFEFSESDEASKSGYWNIHHAIKAHAMRHALPTQIVWESTLHGKSLTQDPATMAWNFFTAIYHKANNIPWQLEWLPNDTVFVGISFFRKDPAKAALQTSLAQAFSGRGEGLVLQGPKSITDRDGNPVPHLGEKEAEDLLRGVLKLYTDHHEIQAPKRVVIHKTSRYWPEELQGFLKALDGVPRYDLLAIETLGHRFFRSGEKPPVRGTVVKLAEGHHLLYTTGYVPALRAYPGMRVPSPIEIIEHHGETPADVLCQEIMALTKINWNSCNFACREPITIQFARSVGKILREIPQGVKPQRLYRFYM